MKEKTERERERLLWLRVICTKSCLHCYTPNKELDFGEIEFHITLYNLWNLSLWNLEAVWIFYFFYSFVITHHSSLNFRHLSLKIPQFPQTHPFGTHNTVLSLLFVSKKKKNWKAKIWGWALFKKKKKTLRLNSERVVSLITKMPLETELWKLKGLFGSSISITHISVSITHNSKMMRPMARSLFGTTIILFPWLNSVSMTQFSDFWVVSYENWKHI